MSWWMVAGAVVSAYGAMQAGKARAAEARAQAAQLEEQKKDAVVQTMQEHNIRMANFVTMQGINDSLGGIMGRDIGSDRSLAAIRERAKKEFETETSRQRLQFMSEQSQRTMGIQYANLRARNARTVGNINAVGSLLNAGHQYSKIKPAPKTVSV